MRINVGTVNIKGRLPQARSSRARFNALDRASVHSCNDESE